MKTLLVSFTIISLSIFNVYAQTEPNGDTSVKDELVKLEKQSWEAWKNNDGKFFQNFLSDDHVEIGATGVSNKARIVAGVSSAVCQVRSYSLDHFDLKMLDKTTALLTYLETQDTVCGSNTVPSPCWVGSLYLKRGDRWLNAVYQQTPAIK